MKNKFIFLLVCTFLFVSNMYSQNRGIKYEQLNPSVADSICANCIVEQCDPVRVFNQTSPNGLEISDPSDNTQWQAWIDDYNSVNECTEKTSFIFEGLCRVRDRIVTLRFTPRPITEGVINFTTPSGSQSFTFPVSQLEMCFQENESGSTTPTCDAMELQINNDIEPFGLSITNFFVGQSETQSAASTYSLTFFLNSTGFLSADPIDINGQTINCNVQPDYFVYQSETTESTLVEYPLTSIDVTPCIVKNQPITFSTTVQGAICEIAEYVDTNTNDIEECCPCANVQLSDLGVSDFSDFSEVDAAAQTYISSNRCGAGTNFIGCESQDFVFNIVNVDQNFFPLVEVSNFQSLDFSNGNINAEVWQGGVYMNDIVIISQNTSNEYTVSGTVDDAADEIRVSIQSNDCYVYQSDLNEEIVLIEQPNTGSGGTGPQGPAGADGSDGVDGIDGTNGINCWDLNGNGVNDPSEDTNTDGVFDALDCQGSGGTGVDRNGNFDDANENGKWTVDYGQDKDVEHSLDGFDYTILGNDATYRFGTDDGAFSFSNGFNAAQLNYGAFNMEMRTTFGARVASFETNLGQTVRMGLREGLSDNVSFFVEKTSSTPSTALLGVRTRNVDDGNAIVGQVLELQNLTGEAEWKNAVHLIPIDEFLSNQIITDRTGIVPYLVHSYQSDLNYQIISAEVCIEGGTGSTNIEILHNGSLVFGGPQTVTAGGCIQLTGGTTNVSTNALVRIRTSGTTGAPLGLYANILMQ